MKRYGVLLLLSLFLVSCVSTMITRSVLQPTGQFKGKKKDMMDSITLSLMDNGFEIALANEQLGVINTTYRPIDTASDSTLNTLNAVSGILGSGKSTSRASSLMLSFSIISNGYRIIPKTKKQETSGTYYKTQSESVSYPEEKSDEGKLINKIITEVNTKLNIPDSFVWEEKTITITN